MHIPGLKPKHEKNAKTRYLFVEFSLISMVSTHPCIVTDINNTNADVSADVSHMFGFTSYLTLFIYVFNH
jgi:hypothetical protein